MASLAAVRSCTTLDLYLIEAWHAGRCEILEEIHNCGDTRAAMIENPNGLAIMPVERKES